MRDFANFFYMDPGQIVREYKACKERESMIKALAELNLCEPIDIADFLQSQGLFVPARFKRRLHGLNRDRGNSIKVVDLVSRLTKLPQESRIDEDGIMEIFRQVIKSRCHR